MTTEYELVTVRLLDSDEDGFDGIQLVAGADWSLFSATHELQPDGYLVVRNTDIGRISSTPAADFRAKMLKSEGTWDSLTEIPPIDLDSPRSILSSVQGLGKLVNVEYLLVRESNCAFGHIDKLSKDEVTLLTFDTDGKWDEIPMFIKYDEILTIGFDDLYTSVYAKYLPEIPD